MNSKIKLLLAELLHKLNLHNSNELSDDIENKILWNLKHKGYFVIEGFLSKEICRDLECKTDDFILNNPEKVSFESNGYDKRVYKVDQYDQSFILDDVERISEKIFSSFSYIFQKSFFYLLGRIDAGKENLGSGSGWHRDSAISHQFKTILYLSDVDELNGPFQYIEESHKLSSIKKANKYLNKKLNERRFLDSEIDILVKNNIIPKPKTFTAPAGSLIFVNTRGLHRGTPLIKGNRYALTRYHFSKKNKQFN